MKCPKGSYIPTDEFVLPFGLHVFFDEETIHFDPSEEVDSLNRLIMVSSEAENSSQQVIID
jgi:hypothetical protein